MPSVRPFYRTLRTYAGAYNKLVNGFETVASTIFYCFREAKQADKKHISCKQTCIV